MKFISANYKARKEHPQLTPIFRAIDEYIKDWIANNKDYVGSLVVNFLGIKRLKNTLNVCKKMYKKDPEEDKNIKKICDILRPCGTHTEFVGLITVTQRATQLETFCKNIENAFKKNKLNLENWNTIQQQSKKKKKLSDITKLINEIINIQNEILGVSKLPTFKKKLSKSFAENLVIFIKEASTISKQLNEDSGYLDLMDDLNKIFKSGIKNDDWSVPLGTISLDVGRNIKNKLEEIDKQMKRKFRSYRIKSIFTKKLSNISLSKSENPKTQCQELMINASKAINYVKESFKKLNKKDSSKKKLLPDNEIEKISNDIKDVEKIYDKLNKKYGKTLFD